MSATFDRKTEAKQWAQEQEVKIRQGRFGAATESRKRSVEEMIDRYIRDTLPRKNKKMRLQQTAQLQWWRKQMGKTLLMHASASVIAHNRDKLAAEITVRGRPRAAATVNGSLAALSHTFNTAAREWGWLDDSPVRKVAKLRLPRGRLRFLSDDERERLLKACRASTNQYLYTVVVVALSTGMRLSERSYDEKLYIFD